MFTLKDLIENPDQRFWECDEVEHDATMVELVARAKANREKPKQSAFIERAKKLMYDSINKRINNDPGNMSGRPNPYYYGYGTVKRYRVVCSKCERQIFIPTYIPVDKHQEMLSNMPSCRACGTPDSWTIEEVK